MAIVVREDGRASVQGRYAFTGNPGAMSFEWLERSCATVGPVRLESFGRAVPYARVATGPWVRLHDTSAVDPSRDSLGYTVAYDYSHDGIFELFGSNSNNNGLFISKGTGKKKLGGLAGNRYWHSSNFKLIGWVK